jgi:hypothetical protein
MLILSAPPLLTEPAALEALEAAGTSAVGLKTVAEASVIFLCGALLPDPLGPVLV